MNSIVKNQAVSAPAAFAPSPSMGILMDPARFDHVQRVASMMANSALFPEHLRKGGEKQAIANAILVFDMAFRMQENPLTVAQNIYFVSGKPGWLTTYMIARANSSGVFSDQIEWTVSGQGDDLSVTAFATLAKSGRKAEATVGMAMAKAEGWTSNKKYQSMPERMLRWRSATALIRLYAPEVMIGMPSQIELETGDGMRDVTPPEPTPTPTPTPKRSPAKAKAAEPQEAEEVAAEPDAGAADASPDLEMFQDLTNSILADLAEVSAASVGDVLEMYGAQIDQIKAVAPELHAQIVEAADAKIAE